MKDLTIASVLLLVMLSALFIFFKRFSFLKSEKAVKKFSDSQIKNARRFIYVGFACCTFGAVFCIYRIAIAL